MLYLVGSNYRCNENTHHRALLIHNYANHLVINIIGRLINMLGFICCLSLKKQKIYYEFKSVGKNNMFFSISHTIIKQIYTDTICFPYKNYTCIKYQNPIELTKKLDETSSVFVSIFSFFFFFVIFYFTLYPINFKGS